MTAGLLYAFGYLSRKTTTWRDRETLSLCCGAAHRINWLFGNGPLGHALTASTGFSGTVPPCGGEWDEEAAFRRDTSINRRSAGALAEQFRATCIGCEDQHKRSRGDEDRGSCRNALW
jgi:hypothetical protein